MIWDVLFILSEARVAEDALRTVFLPLMEPIHIQLCKQGCTCRMKLLMLRCLKNLGSTISWNLEISLITNSLPFALQNIIL